MIVQPDYLTDSPNPVVSSGSLAIFAAIRRASIVHGMMSPKTALATLNTRTRAATAINVITAPAAVSGYRTLACLWCFLSASLGPLGCGERRLSAPTDRLWRLSFAVGSDGGNAVLNHRRPRYRRASGILKCLLSY